LKLWCKRYRLRLFSLAQLRLGTTAWFERGE
jgi:hypothetical protein